MSNKQHTPAFKIFKYFYQVQVPQHHLYNKAFIEEFGVPTTGDSKTDSELSKSMVTANIAIFQMAEILDEGSPLVLLDPKKSVEIYESITQHLNNWKEKVEEGFATQSVPMEDLRKLDNLAKEIYPMAKHYMGEKDPNSITSVLSLSSVPTAPRVKRRNEQPVKEESKPRDGHSSIADSISKEVFKQTKNY